MSFYYQGKFFVADKHIPWNYHQSYEWNVERAKLYIDKMKELKKMNYNPYDTSNYEVVEQVNFEMSQKMKKRVFL